MTQRKLFPWFKKYCQRKCCDPTVIMAAIFEEAERHVSLFLQAERNKLQHLL
jgi:hypothetical protein